MPPKGAASPVTTTDETTVTAEGGVGYVRDAKGELFLLAVSNFVNEATFYESAKDRDSRYVNLVRQMAVEDPAWVAGFLPWLRGEGNMRTASIVGAVEAGRVMPAASARRSLLVAVMQRPDEPGEALGYWLSKYGKPLPKWFKKALGDGAIALYHQHSALKYDTQSDPVRFADVIEFSQIGRGRLDATFAKWLIDRRHKRDWTSSEGLPMVQAREALEALPVQDRPAALGGETFKAAGVTWEYVSGWIQGGMTAKVWEALIPEMGYMALLRNLRNFDEAGVSDAVAEMVAARLTDPEQVAKSRQLPMRFLSAYNAAPSDRWKHPLGKAIDLSLAAVPILDGETAVLVDTSGSMSNGFSEKGTLAYWEAAALFGVALAKRQDSARVWSFSDRIIEFPLTKGSGTLTDLAKFRQGYFINSGTATGQAIAYVRQAMPHARRIVILTDEQAFASGYGNVSVERALAGYTGKVYTFNLAGYRAAHMETGSHNRHAFTGLNDSGFRTMALLETDTSVKWPWEGRA
jgi:hypothetical protein